MKRKASPFLPENFVVVSGWKRKGGDVTADYFGRGPRPFDWFTKLLKDTTLLVGVNIKFDLLHALREPQNLDAWMEFVARGGNVWDCQLAEYLLRGMEPTSHMLSMDEMVVYYGGNAKIDEVKALWEAGVDTPDIDKDLILRYLCGSPEERVMPVGPDGAKEWKLLPAQLGDIGNTEKIFLGQLVKARKTGQVKSILLNMGSLLCTVEMERNGMYVDKALGLRLAAELEERLTAITAELRAYLPDDCPFEFNWSNRYHLSPLIFGGTVKYQKRTETLDDAGNLQYFQKVVEYLYLKHKSRVVDGKSEPERMPVSEWHKLDHPPEPIRFASGKNAGEIKTKNVKVPDLERGPKTAMRDFYYKFPGYTTPEEIWASSTPGLYSVSSEVIEALGNRDIPFLKTLANVAKLGKDLGTYYVTTDEKTGEQKGMLTLVGGDSIIHHGINHTSTVTARFSSSNPNLQNVPKEGKSEVKTVFISRYGDDGQIVQSDFTALEVYVQAILTGCKQLIEDLRAGLDMHCVRVSQKEGITYEDALLKCKGDKARGIAPLPEWEKKRSEAKVFSFQRAYGAGAKKIAESTGMLLEDVEALIRAEEVRYPELSAYNAAKTERIKKSRRPTNNIQPHPEVKGLMCQLGKGYSVTPDNKVYSYRESPAPKWLIQQGGTPQSFSPTEIANYEVQGTGGEWAKAAMWLAIRAFYARKNFGGLALLVNQVHDALYKDAHKSVLLESSALLHACMLAASDFMEWYFGWKIPVPVPSVTVHGDNMMEENAFTGDFEERAEQFRVDLRQQYMGGYTPSFIH
ncbi:DNA polymerase A family protein [Burkholderia thailandensis MSMB121]|uniref:DNA polymerase n=1 Tax=Burkholderia humptydooensis TaxID=430531 RepID=UPI000327FFF2|nr:DNA polymerase [Burkholderia humptydooensis]AGK48800.1 DNA polymerase A family protein [Burkholderia thailandensis MSMB121]ATF37696.1 DNA polymerase A family protein [Burkholderia thailandensis]KST75990.1 DNA polymerase A family protein [Burkholderia humptydooensis]